jgi:hypothetical protein
MQSTKLITKSRYTPHNVQTQDYFYIILCNHHRFSYFSQQFDKCEYSELCKTKFTDYKTAKNELDLFRENQTIPKYPKFNTPLILSVCLVRNESYLQKDIVSSMIIRKNRTNVFILENKREN